MTIGVVERAGIKDKCVVCGCETQFDINEHIDFRMGYIDGCGQLCLECWDKIYYKPMIDLQNRDREERIKNDI